MRKLLFAVACFGLVALPVMAQVDVPPELLNVTLTDGTLEGGWVVANPAGTSDYFNARHDGLSGRPIAGISLASADFGSGTSYPQAGLYDANIGLDPSGNTPDLSSGFSAGALAGSGTVFNFIYGSFGGNAFPASEPQHVIVQFPAGDPGLLGIMADSSVVGASDAGWTQDGYATPANIISFVHYGMNPIVNAISELQGLPGTVLHSYLHEYFNGTDEIGDWVTGSVGGGQFYGVVYQTERSGVLWQLWLSFLGAPIKKLTPTLPAIPNNGGGFLRAGGTWPYGFGGLTFNFVAIGGVPGVKGTVHISNEITLITRPDPGGWGNRDDGTYETGWVVSGVAGSSDYFNVNFNIGTAPNNVTDYQLAVMDFGTAFTAYPTSGVFPAQYGVDPSGNTPDLANAAESAPFTFLPGTFASSSGSLVTRDFPDFSYAGAFGGDLNAHGVIQFPAGDPAILGVGGDTTAGGISGFSGWTLDGYASPANLVTYANWGIRLGAN